MALIRDCESFPFLLYFGFFVYSVVLSFACVFLFVWSLCNAMQCILRVIACICSWWRQWRRLFDACFGSSFIFSRQTQYIRRLIFTYTFTFFSMSLSYFFSVSLSFMVYLFAAVQFYAAFFLSLQHDAHQPTQPHYGIYNNHPAHQRYANTRNVTAGYVANAGQCIAAVLLRVLHIWYRRCSTVGRNITTALRSSIAGPCARSQVSPSILIQFIHCLRPVRKKTHSQTPKREGTKVPNNEDNTRKIVQIITSIYRSFLRSVHTLYHFTYILEIIHKHRT